MGSDQVNVFRTRTGTIHARIGNTFNALSCNSRNRGPRGTPGVMDRADLLKHKLCEKCFNVDVLRATTPAVRS